MAVFHIFSDQKVLLWTVTSNIKLAASDLKGWRSDFCVTVFKNVMPGESAHGRCKEVSKGAALLLGFLDFQAAFLGKPHKRVTF